MQHKVILLTGASEGIGRALAHSLSAAGAKLMLAARNLDRLQQLQQQLPCHSAIVALDVADPLQCQQAVDATIAEFGRLDILINNAGITMWSRFDAMDDLAVLEKLMRVNYLGAAYLSRSALPHLKQSRGQLVAVASIAGLTGVPERTGYAASKHAMIGFFDSLRIELRGSGVDVSVLCPDFVVSEIHKRAIGADGQPLGDSPMQQDKIMTSEQCAAQIHQAIERRQRQWIGSVRGKLGRWLKLVAPQWIDAIAAKAIAERR